MDYTDKIKSSVSSWGADLVGVADLKLLKGIQTIPKDLLSPFTRAVSIAVQLPSTVFDMIDKQPTPIYASTYLTANRILDEIAFKTSKLIQDDGYLGLAIPTSQVIDNKEWHGSISHKAVARAAGLGWMGKSLVIINQKYGARIRFATILTNAPLITDSPVKNLCGKCNNCKEACPAKAIKGVNTEDYYKTRDEAVHIHKCAEKLTNKFAKLPYIGVPICGICIKVCPFSKPKNLKKV